MAGSTYRERKQAEVECPRCLRRYNPYILKHVESVASPGACAWVAQNRPYRPTGEKRRAFGAVTP